MEDIILNDFEKLFDFNPQIILLKKQSLKFRNDYRNSETNQVRES